MPKRIFITGASGCIGHYVVESLITETDHHLFLLVRDPGKLKIDVDQRPGINVLAGNLHQIEQYAELLQTIDVAILIAAAWGNAQETFDINVTKTVKLVEGLDPQRCEQVIYFSTASILGRDHQLLREANELGTDYIRTKYVCFQQLKKLAIAPKITTLFPTLVFGGDDRKPKSHISAGLPEVVRWSSLARFFQVEGSFHFIHGRDIAQVVSYLVDHLPSGTDSRELVLGNAAMTGNQLLEDICAYFQRRIYFRIPLTQRLADIVIAVFRIQMAPWDRFCLQYRHFVYVDPVSPATLGRTTAYPDVAALLRGSGISAPAE